MNFGDLRVYPAEIGGAFGGKTVVYIEPVAVVLARKSGPGRGSFSSAATTSSTWC